LRLLAYLAHAEDSSARRTRRLWSWIVAKGGWSGPVAHSCILFGWRCTTIKESSSLSWERLITAIIIVTAEWPAHLFGVVVVPSLRFLTWSDSSGPTGLFNKLAEIRTFCKVTKPQKLETLTAELRDKGRHDD
jgi:hypothetical protein